MSFVIEGIGTAVPEHSVEQQDAAEMAKAFCCHSAKQTRVLSALYRRTGVQMRHSVVLESSTNGEPARQSFFASARFPEDRGPTTARRMEQYETGAAALAIQAAESALEDGKAAREQLTHLVTVSCSGFRAPGFDVKLIQALELRPDIARTHIGFMGCHGVLNGLRVSKAFAEADPDARVLLCAVELCSLHQQYGWDPDRIVANALFADGAAAVVGHGIRTAKPNAWTVTASGSTVIPDSQDVMSWRIRDHGFEMTLSAQVPKLICRHLQPWLESWLARQGLSIADVGSWAIHPGGPRILTACAESAGFPLEQLEPSRTVLAEYGNMSSPTVLFILQRLRQQNARRPCVVLAFGPGLAVEGVLIR